MWGIFTGILQFYLVDIRSSDAFRPIPRAREKMFDGLYSELSILLLAKSVAIETFFPSAHSSSAPSSSSSSRSSPSSPSSSSSSHHRDRHHLHFRHHPHHDCFLNLISLFFQLSSCKSNDHPSTFHFTFLSQDKKRTQH